MSVTSDGEGGGDNPHQAWLDWIAKLSAEDIVVTGLVETGLGEEVSLGHRSPTWPARTVRPRGAVGTHRSRDSPNELPRCGAPMPFPRPLLAPNLSQRHDGVALLHWRSSASHCDCLIGGRLDTGGPDGVGVCEA